MSDQILLPARGSDMELALNAALGDFRMAAARQRFAYQGMDTKRQSSWDAFGWNENPQFLDYYRLWERGGLAHGAISRTVTKCWQDNPSIDQGDIDEGDRPRTPWETKFAKFAKTFDLWGVMREADTRRCVGHYSALILQIADNQTWDKPVMGGRAKRLVKIIPAWEGQLYPTEYQMDQTKADYGEPTMYTFSEGAVGVANNRAAATFAGRLLQIHPDRVVILGDITHGIPMLRAGYNDFANLEKILGGSGESFLKNAARQIAIEFEREVDLEDIAHAHKVPLKDLRKVYDQVTLGLNRGIDQTIVTQGAKVNPLTTSVPDPEKHFEASCMSAAASIMIPLMIWIGSQTGERASTQDQADWANTCQGRRVHMLTRDIERVVNRLIALRLVDPIEDFTVAWSELGEATQAEKLANGKLMSDINAANAATGEITFTTEEIRTACGHTNQGVKLPALPDVDPQEDDQSKDKGGGAQ